MKKPIGLVLYKGPSQIDGKLIVVLATGIFNQTDNEKTGNMIQTWILRADIPPIIAKQLGHDYSVCGDCKHRHFGSCYVNIAHGPHNTYNAYHRDRYAKFNEEEHLELFRGRKIRLGSYGDPAAVPTEVWDKVCSVASGWTGYTHQWNTRFVDPDLRKFCMASCDNTAEYIKAEKFAWRIFRVRMSDGNVATDRLNYNEVVCPASNEAGNKTSCAKCGLCMGTASSSTRNPVIIVHGLDHKIASFKYGMQRIKWKEKYRKVFQYPLKKKKKYNNKKRKRVKSPEGEKVELIVS